MQINTAEGSCCNVAFDFFIVGRDRSDDLQSKLKLGRFGCWLRVVSRVGSGGGEEVVGRRVDANNISMARVRKRR